MYEIFDFHIAVRLNFEKQLTGKLRWLFSENIPENYDLKLPYWQFDFNVVLLIASFVLKDCKLIRHSFI